jgi:hypothetical protein
VNLQYDLSYLPFLQDATPAGSIQLHGTFVDECVIYGVPFTFSITPHPDQGGRVFYIAAESEFLQKDWIHSIKSLLPEPESPGPSRRSSTRLSMFGPPVRRTSCTKLSVFIL